MSPSVALPVERLSTRWPGGSVELAVRFRPAGEDLLVCLHGFGCAKECFESGFEVDRLASMSMVTFDFPGHGRSDRLPPAADAIQSYADLTVDLIRHYARGRVFLVCHSMGCAVGLLASQELPRLAGFVSVEGNLVSQDCGIVSRRAAELSQAHFVRWEYPSFRARLAEASSLDLQAWAQWYAQADPATLHQVAGSLVQWSDSGKLLALLTSLQPAAYVYGQQNQDELRYLLSSLKTVPAYPIAGASHFPMLDNPDEFWRTIADVFGR